MSVLNINDEVPLKLGCTSIILSMILGVKVHLSPEMNSVGTGWKPVAPSNLPSVRLGAPVIFTPWHGDDPPIDQMIKFRYAVTNDPLGTRLDSALMCSRSWFGYWLTAHGGW